MLNHVSVIIPVYRVTRYLEEALQSVRKQTHSMWEIIIIDDGNDDATVAELHAIAGKYSDIRIISIKHSGPGTARAAGIEASKSDYILFLDADDMLHENAIATLLKSMSFNVSSCGVYGCSQRVDQGGHALNDSLHPGEELRLSGKELLLSTLSGQASITMGAVLISRSSLVKCPVDFRGLYFGEDWAMLCGLMMRENINFVQDNAVLSYYRKHAQSTERHNHRWAQRCLESIARVYEADQLQSIIAKEKLDELRGKISFTPHRILCEHYTKLGDKHSASKHFHLMDHTVLMPN